jgi:HSP20 family protein
MTATMRRGLLDDWPAVQDTGSRWDGSQVGGEQGDGTDWRPAVDVSERGDAYVVTVEIPGIRADDLEVTMADGVLTIQGSRHDAREAAGEKIHRSERGRGVFQRLITLPSSHVKADGTKASARDGVLRILVPKARAAQAGPVRVRVRASHSVVS